MEFSRRQLLGMALGGSVLVAGCFSQSSQSGRERVVVENRTAVRRIATILVLDEQGNTLVEGTYAVPSRAAIRFEQTFEYGVYEIRAREEGGSWQSMTWEPQPCDEDSAPGNSTAGVVFEDEMSIVANTCETAKLGEFEDEYLPALQHRLDTESASQSS